MKKFSPYFLILLFLVFSCKKAEEERGDEEEVISEVSQPGQRKVNATDIVVPEGYKIEAIEEGLTYPVDITFDEDGSYYIAEAGGHTYGTKPARAPEARILKGGPNKKLEIFYDQVVPMTEIKEEDSSEDMEEGLIPPVTGVTFYKGNLYVS
ncbi:hypothetical protein, partial [Salinimicrobium oceani]